MCSEKSSTKTVFEPTSHKKMLIKFLILLISIEVVTTVKKNFKKKKNNSISHCPNGKMANKKISNEHIIYSYWMNKTAN